jgi:hypothetical protein
MSSATSAATIMFMTPAVTTIVIIVPWSAVITDTFLATAPSSVPCIPVAVVVEVIIGPCFVDDYFIPAVKIIAPVSSRQVGGEYPTAGIEVNELLAWYVVISFHIGQVVIIHPVIS